MTLVDKGIQVENAGWTFENIAEDFDEHVQKSVPLYDEGHELICNQYMHLTEIRQNERRDY